MIGITTGEMDCTGNREDGGHGSSVAEEVVLCPSAVNGDAPSGGDGSLFVVCLASSLPTALVGVMGHRKGSQHQRSEEAAGSGEGGRCSSRRDSSQGLAVCSVALSKRPLPPHRLPMEGRQPPPALTVAMIERAAAQRELAVAGLPRGEARAEFLRRMGSVDV